MITYKINYPHHKTLKPKILKKKKKKKTETDM